MKRFIITLIMSLLSTGYAFAAEVTLTINNIEKAEGNIMVGVCASEAEFLEQKPVSYGFHFPAKEGSITETISVPAGEYAVIVYHDANSDKILNKGFMGKPTEKYGFSNNFFGSFGKKPDYDKAMIKVIDGSNTFKINLR